MERTDRGGNAERDGKARRGGKACGDEKACRGQGEDSNRMEEQCENELPGGHEERAAAMAWTRIAEGEDAYAVALVREMGYARALEWVAEGSIAESRNIAQAGKGAESGSVAGLGGFAEHWTVAGCGDGAGRGLAKAKARWKTRLAALGPGVAESDGAMGFVMPGDPLWPAALDDLGDTRPLGLWFRGDGKVLARAGAAVVGSRDSSPYGVKIATDVAYELADSGVNVVSGGAFGIDVAAHRGALAADGYTVAVSACGVDRYYPASHADLYLEILRRAGGRPAQASFPFSQSDHCGALASRSRRRSALSIRSNIHGPPRHVDRTPRRSVPGPGHFPQILWMPPAAQRRGRLRDADLRGPRTHGNGSEAWRATGAGRAAAPERIANREAARPRRA